MTWLFSFFVSMDVYAVEIEMEFGNLFHVTILKDDGATCLLPRTIGFDTMAKCSSSSAMRETTKKEGCTEDGRGVLRVR